jgi:hypothetical protein
MEVAAWALVDKEATRDLDLKNRFGDPRTVGKLDAKSAKENRRF